MHDEPTVESIQGCLDRIKTDVKGRCADGRNVRLRECWPRWEHLIEDLQQKLNQKPDVSVSLIGGTGAGKTSLINAVLGEAILPTSSVRACTSAVCEIGYSPDGCYHAEVMFISREEWQKEATQLRTELTRLTGREDGDPKEAKEFASQALDKLRAVYGIEDHALLSENRPEPAEIAQALHAGRESFSNVQGKDFADRIVRYLSSAHCFWPIVRSVRITGPFKALATGVRLVDLPGINDPNEAREQVTRNYLKQCKFAWIIFPAKRSLTRDLHDLILREDLFRELFLNGLTDRLSFVATATDDLDVESAINEFKLLEDAALSAVFEARKDAIRYELKRTLGSLVARLAEDAEESGKTSSRIAKWVENPTLFAVSAQDYALIRKGRRPRLVETSEQTELPTLLAHLDNIAAKYGTAGHLSSIERQRKQLISEIESESRGQKIRLEQQRELNAQQREEVISASGEALAFLESELGKRRTVYAETLRGNQAVLQERFRRGIERGRAEVGKILARWEAMHWKTLVAVCGRGGKHTTSRGPFDLPLELAEPLLGSIAFAWDDFFGERLGAVMQDGYGRLRSLAEQNATSLRTALSSRLGDRSRVRQEIQKQQQATERVLTEQTEQSRVRIEHLIEETRCNLHDRIPGRIRTAMRNAFIAAGNESGDGMKKRIIEAHLAPAARRVVQDVYSDAQGEIDQRVRGLEDEMVRTYAEMAETVLRHARATADNFRQAVNRHLSVEGLDKEMQELERVIEMVTALRQETA